MKGFSNKFLPLLMLIVCSILGTTDAWAGKGSTTYYAKLTASVSSDCEGRGTVYAATSNNSSGTYAQTSVSTTQNSSTQNASLTFYAFAKTASDDYKFLGWSETATGATSYDNTNGKSYTVSASATSEGSASNKNVYAYFARKIYAKATAGIDDNGTGTGTVCVSWTSTASPSYATTSEVTYNEYGTKHTQNSIQRDVYFYAQPGTNAASKAMIFQGWYDESGNSISGNNPYSVSKHEFSGTTASEVGLALYARFKDPDVVATPKIELENRDEATELTLKIDETQKVVYTSYDAANLSALSNPTINVINRVDVGSDPIIVWDAATRTITANRAGTATITFHHAATDDYSAADFTFTIHVEKITPEFSWKTSALLDGQTYTLSDLIDTESDGAWNIVSSKETVFASISQAGTQSATAHVGSTTLTFSQGLSYKYNAIPAVSKTFKVYTNEGFATYLVGSTTYSDFAVALTEASKLSKNKYVIVNTDGALIPGNYTVPSGVSVIVPHKSGASLQTKPEVVTTAATLEAYRTWKILEGTNITVNGTICVCGKDMSAAGGNPSGYPTGGVGVIDMSTGGHIELNSGAKMYCWGFVRGQGYLDGNNTQNVGTITAKNGSEVWENFFVGDWRGGTATSSLAGGISATGNGSGFFPFQSYSIQNIEIPITYNYGASGQVYITVYGGGGTNEATGTVIGNSKSLFLLKDNNSTVRKWYDPTTDLVNYELTGTASLASLQVKVYISVDSKNYNLPINSSMQININCDMELASPLTMHAGSVIHIMPDKTVTLSSKLHIFDQEDWGMYLNGAYFRSMTNLTPHVSRGAVTSKSDLADGKIIVDGKLIVTSTGKLYTTAGGADIMSHGDGQIVYQGGVPTDATLKSYTAVSTEATNTITAAKLHNENGSYTASLNTTTFDNLHGRWFTHAAATTLDANHMYDFTYIGGSNKCFYAADKTGLMAGYKWVDLKETDNAHTCGSTMTFVGKDDNLYTFKNGEWLQLVQIAGGTTYSGSDDNLYQFLSCDWVSLGEIGPDCMYTVDGVKKAVVGSELVALEKDEYDEVYVKTTDHSDYYMLFDGCVWQHAEKVPDTYKAYIVLGNYYVWIDNAWTEVEKEDDLFYTTDDQGLKHYYEYDGDIFAWVPVKDKVLITTAAGDEKGFRNWDDAMLYVSQFNNPTVTLLADVETRKSFTMTGNAKTTNVTIDLNDHMLNATVAQVINFNGAGKTLTITDNSDKQRGQIHTVYSVNNTNETGYAISIAAGTFNLNAGTIYAQNNNTGSNARSGCVYVKGGATFNMNGGKLHGFSDYARGYGAYGLKDSKIFINPGAEIYAESATSNTFALLPYGQCTIDGAKITAIAGTTTCYGIYVDEATASLNISNSTIYAEGKGKTTTSAADVTVYAINLNKAINMTVTNSTISAVVSNYGFGQNARAINTVAGANVTLNSGTVLNAEAYKNAYGIVQASSAATQSTSVLTINEGVTINAKARTYAFGVQGYGNMTINGTTINAQTCELGGLPGTTYAYGVYAHASANATAANSYYSVLKATNCNINVKASTVYGYGYFVLGTSANSTTAVDGTWSNKASARATITGGTVNVDCGNSDANSYAYGIWSRAGVDENGTQDAVETVIKNVTIKAHGTHRYVYGIFAAADAADYTGGCTRGNVNVDGVDVTAISDYTSDSYAYGAYVQTSAIWINRGKYKKDVATNSTNKKTWYVPADSDDDDVSHEALNGTESNTNIYRIGEYAVGAKMVINGGTFRANTTVGSHAFGVQNSRSWSYNRNKVAYGDLIINGGTFVANTNTTNAMGVYNYGNTTINGGTFTGNTTTTTAYGAYGVSGTMQINAGTFNANATTNTAYGIAANGTIDGNYCYVDEGVITVEDGVEVNVKSLGGATAYGVYVTGVTKDYTQATYDGRTAANREYYYFSELDGTILTNATKANAFRIVKGQFSASGKVIVNGGTFNVNTSTKDSYGVDVITARTVGTATTYPVAEVNGGFFNITSGNSTGASAVKLDALKEYCVIKGGHFNINGNLTSSTATKNYVNAPYYVLDCKEDIYKSKYPYEVAQAYIITFKDDADNELWSDLLPTGKPALYPINGGVAEKTSTPSASYEFTGWSDGVNTYAAGSPLPNVTGEVTYTAQFNEVAKRYMVTWYDDNNAEIDHMEWASGATPAHAIPYKEGHTFSHWTPSIRPIAGEAQDYHAVFTPNQYTITWLDENGNQLQQESLNYGAKPTHTAPEKDGYTFYRWEPALETVSADAIYQATYRQNVASVTTSAGVETIYTSWASALTAANALNGATLKLLANVNGLVLQTVKTNLILDLNGYTLSGPGGKAVDGTYALLNLNTAGKVLTITDNSNAMTGTINTTVNTAVRLAAVYVSNGKVVLDKGTLHAENLYTTINTAYRALGIFAETSGSIEVNGGVIEAISSSGYSYGIFAKSGTLAVKNCQITSRAQQYVRGIYTQVNATIQNVVIDVDATNAAASSTANIGAYGIYCDATGGAQLMVDNVTINAQSAKLEAYGVNLYSNNTGTLSNLKIQAKTAPIDTDAPATLKITSGFFDKETNLAKYIGTKKVVALVSEPEKAEGYNYKIVDAAYQITFLAEDGTELQQSNVEAGVRPVFMGEEPTKPSNPRTSYEFAGWSDGVNTYTTAEIPVATAAATYTAVFIAHGVEYPITFYNIDGKGGTYVQMVEYGTVPVYNGPAPFSSGNIDNVAYIFNGWTPALTEVTEPTTYEAAFRLEIAVDVTFHANGRGTDPVALKVAQGAAVERPADQLVDCQHIEGWYTESGCVNEWNFASDLVDDTDIDLYAKWGTKTYIITWLDEFGDEIDQTVVDCGAVPSHADLYKPSTAAYSYDWNGWNKTLVAAAADATYKSLGFTQVPKRFAIIFNTNGGSAIAPIEQDFGTDITAPADPTRTGYTFDHWEPAIPATMPAEDVTITAIWTVNQYNVSWDAAGGDLSGDYTSGSVDYGTTIVAPTATKDGYEFESWSPAVPATVTGNLSFTAQWELAETGEYMDIVDWTTNSVTLNMNGYQPSATPWRVEIRTTSKVAGDRATDRTLTFTDLFLTANDQLTITAYGGSTTDSKRFYTIPNIYEGEVWTLGGTELNDNSIILVREGVLTISTNTQVDKVIVNTGAGLVISNGAVLTCNKLVLRTKAFEDAATFTCNGTLSCSDVCYTRIVADKSQYLPFALPFAFNTNNVTLSSGTAPYGSQWILRSYSENQRATSGPNDNWVAQSAGKVDSCKGFEMFSNSAYYREYYFPVTLTSNSSVAVTRSDGTDANAGWNNICSPLTGVLTISNPAEGILVSELQKDGTYKQGLATEIRPASPFFYQTAAAGTLSFASTMTIPQAVAARRVGSQEHSDAQIQWLNITVEDVAGLGDQTNVFSHPDNYSLAYEAGKDLEKLSLTGARPLIYNVLPCGSLAFAAIPDSIAEVRIPLAVFAPKNENLTIALSHNDYLSRVEKVFLVDELLGTATDLLSADYVYEAEQGTADGRFYIRVVFRAPELIDTPTDVEDNENNTINNQVQKVYIGGHIYILRDGDVFDMTGRKTVIR